VFFNEQRYWPTILKAKDYGLQIGAYIDYYTQDTVAFFDLFDFLVCNTKRHYSVFNWHRECYLIPWGVSKTRWPRKTNLDSKTITFIISGGWDGIYAKENSWMDRRGVGSTIKVFRRVRGDCKLFVYSQVPLSECPLEWQINIAADDRINFIHGTFEPFPFFSGDVYVYPARLDGIGLTVPEAICAGLPVIATDSPPMNEFVSEGINGSLIKVSRQISRPDGYYWPEALICENSFLDAMQKYVDNTCLAQKQGRNSLRHSLQFFQWESNAKQVACIFARQFVRNIPSEELRRSVSKYSLKQVSAIRYWMTRAIKKLVECCPRANSMFLMLKTIWSRAVK
jgi:glycosyltransferase involved in cell wall biosynthesis